MLVFIARKAHRNVGDLVAWKALQFRQFVATGRIKRRIMFILNGQGPSYDVRELRRARSQLTTFPAMFMHDILEKKAKKLMTRFLQQRYAKQYVQTKFARCMKITLRLQEKYV